MYAETLKLVVSRGRRPSLAQPGRLHGLFRRLQTATDPGEATRTEDEIWATWMTPRRGTAAEELERATRAIVASDFPVAERILAGLTWAHPGYAEAWNKRATLYYLQSRDDESVANIRRTLELEPRHFGAICGFAQILLSQGDHAGATFAFHTALELNPHLADVREAADKLLTEPMRPVH